MQFHDRIRKPAYFSKETDETEHLSFSACKAGSNVPSQVQVHTHLLENFYFAFDRGAPFVVGDRCFHLVV